MNGISFVFLNLATHGCISLTTLLVKLDRQNSGRSRNEVTWTVLNWVVKLMLQCVRADRHIFFYYRSPFAYVQETNAIQRHKLRPTYLSLQPVP